MRSLFNRKGQSIIEITLMTPLILITLYVPADFGVAFLTAHQLQNAVRDAARIGSVLTPFNSSTIQTEALNRMPAKLTSKTTTATLYATGAADCAQFVEVTGSGTYEYFFYKVMRLFGATVPDNRTISRTSRVRYALQPTANSTLCTS